MFYIKCSGHNFPILRPKTKLFAVKFRRILEVFHLQVLQKKFWAQFLDLWIRKRSCFLWSSDAFRKYSACKVYRKSSGRNSTICVQKWSCLLWSSVAFSTFSPFKLYKKVLGTFSRFMRPKTKLFVVKFRCILEVICHSSIFVLKKRSALLWGLDTFWKLSNLEFGSFARLIKKLWAHFHDLRVAQTNILDFNAL